jgi:hypothetical protein
MGYYASKFQKTEADDRRISSTAPHTADFITSHADMTGRKNHLFLVYNTYMTQWTPVIKIKTRPYSLNPAKNVVSPSLG